MSLFLKSSVFHIFISTLHATAVFFNFHEVFEGRIVVWEMAKTYGFKPRLIMITLYTKMFEWRYQKDIVCSTYHTQSLAQLHYSHLFHISFLYFSDSSNAIINQGTRIFPFITKIFSSIIFVVMWNINKCTHRGRGGQRAQTAFHEMLQAFV